MPESGSNDAATKTNHSGMTLPFLESASFWANVFVILFTVLAAIAAGFALHFSSRLSAAKDADLDRFKTESATAIATADASSADANRKAAEANERAIGLEVEAAKQHERAARAEKDLLELQQRLAWRVVSEEQRRIIAESLAPYRGQTLKIFVLAGSEEVDRFARQLAEVFRSAGIAVNVNEGTVFGTARSGIDAIVGRNRIAFANAIGGALSSAAITERPLPARESSDPDELTLRVWPKGQ